MEITLPFVRLRARKPQRHYLFPPGWRVPDWIEDIRPNEYAEKDWKKGFGRFVSMTYVRRESDMVYVYPIGINCGMIFLVDNGTTLHGAPTCLCGNYMIGSNRRVIRVNFRKGS